MKNSPITETIYASDDKIVTVIRKNRGLKRYPRHNYKCVIFLLRPTKNTRVCVDKNGLIEYLATFDEIKAMLEAIDPKLAARLPKTMKNKPLRVKERWDGFNAKRVRGKRRT